MPTLEARQKKGHKHRMNKFKLNGFDLDKFVRDTLAEDLGEGLPGGGRDVTAASVIPADARFQGVMDSRDPITVAGLPIAAAFFRHLDPDMAIEVLVEEGAQVAPGTDLMRLSGNARAMLTAERSALNTVQHLSGIATMVREYVTAMDNPDCTLLDTRKTIPGLRHLEKYAVRQGGADNHRMGLWDAAMIKDNHILVAGDVGEACGARAMQVSSRSSARSTGSTRSNRPLPPEQRACCSTICRPKPCAKPSRWSPDACRPRQAAASIWIQSGPRPQRA